MPTTDPAPHADHVRAIVSDETARTVEIRRDLHAHPELMFEEERTAGVVARELTELGVEHRAGLARGTGVLAWLPATTDPDRAATIALRADMDALPIQEETEKPYKSTRPGLMHACGHDGHTAILLGAARVLARLDERPHNVLLMFQPAEEGGAGAEKMVADGALDGSLLGRPADLVYGLHGWPDMDAGVLSTKPGALLAATDEFIVRVRGRGCHAAYPHLGVDPVVVAAHTVTALQTISARRVAPTDPVIVTVGAIHGGTTFNVIPDAVEIKGTIRTLAEDTRRFVEEEFRGIVGGVATSFGATAEIEWHAGYPATYNDEAATERFRRVAESALGPHRFVEKPCATMGGEDFSYYGQAAPACFFMLGLRPPTWHTYPNLHTPGFDFNDQAVPAGVETMVRLATDPV